MCRFIYRTNMKLKFLLRCIPDLIKDSSLYAKGYAIIRLTPSTVDLMDTVYFTITKEVDVLIPTSDWAFYKLRKLNRK